MRIILESHEECEALKKIITDFDDRGKIEKNKSVDRLISDLRSSVNLHYIKGIDIIGPVHCKFCKKSWVAIFSAKTETLECPYCSKRNTVPKQITKEGGSCK